MNTDNMTKQELRNYIISLLDKLDENQLKEVLVFLEEIILNQEGN